MHKEEFVTNTQRKCVTIHAIGEFKDGKILYVEADWDLFNFLKASSYRLDLPFIASRVFNANGTEIDDCMMIEDNDILFLSNGQDFVLPPPEHGEVKLFEGKKSETIPSTIGGYSIGKLLGKGGFGEVRVGVHQVTGEKIALKFLRKSDIASIGAAERTSTEIQCLMILRHPNIIRLQQDFETPHHVVLVFELMGGGDLFRYLERRQREGMANCSGTSDDDSISPNDSNFALTENVARMAFSQIVSGIGYAHNQHICHRDLKLENVLLKYNDLSCLKIADFGLSTFYRPGALMKSTCGTLSFLAPEVFRGTSNAGPPLDVWSLGVILFSLLCGRLPFEGSDFSAAKRPKDSIIQSRIVKGVYKIDERLSPEVKDLVRRMLRSDPSLRASVPEIFSHCWMRASNMMSYGDSSAGVISTTWNPKPLQTVSANTSEKANSTTSFEFSIAPIAAISKSKKSKFEGSGDALDGISLPDVASRSSSISGSQSHDRNSNSPPFIDVKCDEEDLLQELNCSYDATRGIGTPDNRSGFAVDEDSKLVSGRKGFDRDSKDTISSLKNLNSSFTLMPLRRQTRDSGGSSSSLSPFARPSTVDDSIARKDETAINARLNKPRSDSASCVLEPGRFVSRLSANSVSSVEMDSPSSSVLVPLGGDRATNVTPKSSPTRLFRKEFRSSPSLLSVSKTNDRFSSSEDYISSPLVTSRDNKKLPLIHHDEIRNSSQIQVQDSKTYISDIGLPSRLRAPKDTKKDKKGLSF